MVDTTADAREQLRTMALGLATGTALVEPSMFNAAIDAHRAAVLREAADRIETLMDQAYETALSDHEIGWANGLENAKEELRRLADETPDADAHPPHHRWYVETRDGLADEWAPGMRFTERAEAVQRYQIVTDLYPTWRDGTPVERRLVRETTTYTVEQPAVEAQQDGGQP